MRLVSSASMREKMSRKLEASVAEKKAPPVLSAMRLSRSSSIGAPASSTTTLVSRPALAAPVEFADHVGMPLREGLTLVRSTLVGLGLRERIRIGASGKMVTAHPGYSGIIMTHVLALVNLYGWDYFRDLAKNKLHIVQSANDPAGVVASGERPVGVNGAEYFYYKTQKQGNPIKIIYPKEGVPLVVSPVAIAKDAPHPNAAKLFTEFIFAKESQQLLADKEGLYTGHPEVTYPADKPKLKDLKLLPADADELERRNAEIKKRFVEYFGA